MHPKSPTNRAHTPASHRTAEAIARVMADRATLDGRCTEGDLRAAGFTDAEIAAHGPAATAKARKLTAGKRITPATRSGGGGVV